MNNMLVFRGNLSDMDTKGLRTGDLWIDELDNMYLVDNNLDLVLLRDTEYSGAGQAVEKVIVCEYCGTKTTDVAQSRCEFCGAPLPIGDNSWYRWM